jgi:hypothetical protein
MMGLKRRFALPVLIALLLAAGALAARASSDRPDHLRVPTAAQVLRISWTQPGRRPLVVTSLTKVRRIARLADDMAPNPTKDCLEGFPPANITFSFLGSRRGHVLARLGGVTFATSGAACDPTTLFVRGHPDQLLEDDSRLLDQASRILDRRLR